MITKKLRLCGVLSAATLFSSATFAFYYTHHHDHPRIQFNHHHHQNLWRNNHIHRWAPQKNIIVVPAREPYPRIHQHY